MDEKQRGAAPDSEEFTPVDGPAIAARILRRMPIAERARVVHKMYDQDPHLAVKVQHAMYNFDELKDLSPQGAQTLVREADHRDIALSIPEASREVKSVLLGNMTDRKRAMVLEDSEVLFSQVTPAERQEAQWRILEKLDQLREAGVVRTQTKNGILA